jgi:hypothetical protein
MQPMPQSDRTRHRIRRKTLRDNRRLLGSAPTPPPHRAGQNLDPAEALLSNWQITWHTNLLAVPLRRGPPFTADTAAR